MLQYSCIKRDVFLGDKLHFLERLSTEQTEQFSATPARDVIASHVPLLCFFSSPALKIM